MKRRFAGWLHSRAFWGVVSLLALGLVFMAYLQPELMVDLANRVWSCF